MTKINLKKKDIEWISKKHPSLQVNKNEEGVYFISGIFKINMLFCNENNSYIINPNDNIKNDKKIVDEYNIKILLETNENSILPKVYETKGRIEKLSQTKKIKIFDLHINPNDTMCICIVTKEKQYLPNGFNLEDFFNNLLTPFFYAQSFFEKKGFWPWGEYKHGLIGILESYIEIDSKEEDVRNIIEVIKNACQKSKSIKFTSFLEQFKKKKVKGKNNCLICKSGKYWKDCCKPSFLGVEKIRSDIEKNKIKITEIF